MNSSISTAISSAIRPTMPGKLLGEDGAVEAREYEIVSRAKGSERTPSAAARSTPSPGGRLRDAALKGSVSTCARWRIPVVGGVRCCSFWGMKRNAVRGMSINGGHASVRAHGARLSPVPLR